MSKLCMGYFKINESHRNMVIADENAKLKAMLVMIVSRLTQVDPAALISAYVIADALGISMDEVNDNMGKVIDTLVNPDGSGETCMSIESVIVEVISCFTENGQGLNTEEMIWKDKYREAWDNQIDDVDVMDAMRESPEPKVVH